jgi:hypothetical protein
MKRFLHAATAALALGVGFGTGTADAQFQYQRPVTNPRPPLNPILNLNRASPVVNYYGVVRPQRQTAQTIQQMQQQFKELTPALPLSPLGPEPTASPMISTGHPVQFGNTVTYFPLAGSRSAGMVGGMPQQAPVTTGIMRR